MSRICPGFRTFIAAVTLPVFAGACVHVDATRPLVPSTLDAALIDVAHPALDWPAQFFSGTNIITLPIVPARCPLDSTSLYFVCSPRSGGGLTLNQRFTLLDAGGGKQSVFDETTTAGLHLENGVSGTRAGLGTIDGQQVLDLTGLGTPRHTLNGTSLTLVSGNSERRTTITDLVIPVVAAGSPVAWPLSGTIDTRSRTITAQGDTSVFIATMRFDGSSMITLTVTIPGGIQTCRVNLVTLPPGGMGCVGSPDRPLGPDLLP